MKLFLAAAAVVATAWAQGPEVDVQKLKAELEATMSQSKVIALRGGVMGATVKNAPYSGIEINESNQMLGDGTRIHNEQQTKVYRDGEGRTRRENGDEVTIMDPVAGTTFVLNPKTQTARKTTLSSSANFVFNRSTNPGESVEVRAMTTNGVTSAMMNGKPVDPATLDQMKMNGELPVEFGVVNAKGGAAGNMVYLKTGKAMAEGKPESLGKQSIEGVLSDGMRITNTLPVGAIGNDRPIESVTERWYSPELQTFVMTKHTDPRSGDETFRLTSVVRGEPSPDLFQVPPSYQIMQGGRIRE